MADWEIISKREAILEDGLWTIVSLGAYKIFGCKSYEYIIEHTETGKRKTVFAENEYELGEIIADGDFDDDDDKDDDDNDDDYNDDSDDDNSDSVDEESSDDNSSESSDSKENDDEKGFWDHLLNIF